MSVDAGFESLDFLDPEEEAAAEETPEEETAEESEPEEQEAAPEEDVEPEEAQDSSPEEAKPEDIVDNPEAPEWARLEVVKNRKMRQEAQEQLAEMQKILAGYQQNAVQQQEPEQPAKEEPDYEEMFYQDPAGFVRNQVSSMRENMEAEFSQRMQRMRIEESEKRVRSRHEDFDQVSEAFIEYASNNPQVIAEMNAHPEPAQYAYDYGKAITEVGEVGSVSELRDKIREEIRAEFEAERQQAESNAAISNASPSSASMRTAGRQSASAYVEDVDLDIDDILAGINNPYGR